VNSVAATRPYHGIPRPVPVRVRPRHRERTGSFLIRVAAANHCPPWSFLRLLGNLDGQQTSNLTPRACVTMNPAALHRLSGYLGRPPDQLTRALPWIVATDHWEEPTVRIHRLGRTFLSSCPGCEQQRGTPLMPDPDPLELACRRHDQWLVTDEHIRLDQAHETTSAINRLRRLRRRHGDELIRVLYQRIHSYLTNDWRGTGWHRSFIRRWTDRQHRMHPTAHPNDEFVRSHTHHWSMLPETVDLIRALARKPPGPSSADEVRQILDLDRRWIVDRTGTRTGFTS